MPDPRPRRNRPGGAQRPSASHSGSRSSVRVRAAGRPVSRAGVQRARGRASSGAALRCAWWSQAGALPHHPGHAVAVRTATALPAPSHVPAPRRRPTRAAHAAPVGSHHRGNRQRPRGDAAGARAGDRAQRCDSPPRAWRVLVPGVHNGRSGSGSHLLGAAGSRRKIDNRVCIGDATRETAGQRAFSPRPVRYADCGDREAIGASGGPAWRERRGARVSSTP